MSSSTPISQLRKGTILNEEQSNNYQQMENMNSMNAVNNEMQFVEDIMKEIGHNPNLENQANINSGALQYVTDGSQVPPHKYNVPQSQQGKQQYEYEYFDNADNNSSNSILNYFGIKLNNGSFKDKCYTNVKLLILVFILTFIISLPEFNRFLFGFFPRLLLESGQINIYGVLLKSFLTMIAFFIISFFL